MRAAAPLLRTLVTHKSFRSVENRRGRITKAYARLLIDNVTFRPVATILRSGSARWSAVMGRRMKLIVRIAVAVVVLAVVGVAGWMYLAPSEARVEPVTIKVARGDIEQSVLATGALQAQSVTSVGAQVTGTNL